MRFFQCIRRSERAQEPAPLYVNVTPQAVKVECVRKLLPEDDGPDHRHGSTSRNYEVKSRETA